MDAVLGEVTKALAPWALPTTTGMEEIEHGGRAGRAWLLDSASERWVVKLIFDRPEYAVPGLAVSMAVAAAGVRCGPPLLTRAGTLAVEGPPMNGHPTTLAVLRHEPGRPLDPMAPDAAVLAGRLLAHVHGVLLDARPTPVVPGRLLDWYGQRHRHSGNQPGLEALAGLRRFEVGVPLTYGIVYGDPSPEIVVDDLANKMALIDWGTPSWGPLMHDVATWACFIARGSGRSGDAELFVDAYRSRGRLRPEEYRARPLLDAIRDVG